MAKRRWGGTGRRSRPRPRGKHRDGLSAERLEERRMLAAAPLVLESDYGRVNAAWFAAAISPADDRVAAKAATAEADVATDGATSEWVVRLSAAALASVHSVADAAAYFKRAGAGVDVVRGLGLPGQVLVRAAAGIDVAGSLRSIDGVSYVTSNTVHSAATIPNDPLAPQLYGLDNSGQTGGRADADIDAPEAWDVSSGTTATVVGVIDTGIDWTHPDLAANIWTNPGEIPDNELDDDDNGFIDDVHGFDFVHGDGDPMDDHWHGTHVAGTIGAVGNNGSGVVGVNWDVSLMALKFLDSTGSGRDADAIAAINYATMMRSMYGINVRVLNASWGGGDFDVDLLDAINASGAAGILFVAAAGNSASNDDVAPFYPATYRAPSIVSVAATDANDALASFSNYGRTTVDLAAPGVNILSTAPGNAFGWSSGTSMATPLVTGVAALAAGIDPTLGVQALKGLLMGNVDSLPGLANKTVSGGRLNADKVARAALAGAAMPAISGTVFDDLDSSGGRDDGEPVMRGITVFADENGDGLPGPGEPSAVTGASGRYSLTGLAAGSHPVRAVAPAGWMTPGSRSVTVIDGGTATGSDLGLARRNALSGRLFDDLDGNGLIDPGEGVLAGLTVFDDGNGNGQRDTALITAGSGAVGLPIYGASTTTASITITGQTQAITDLDVSLNLTHPRTGNLLVRLVAPDGTTITLANRRGSTGANYTATVFDDEAATSIASGVAPFTGRYRPDGSLSVIDGASPNGTWRLQVTDDVWGDVGTLDSWSLVFSTAERSATTNASGLYRLAPLVAGSHPIRLLPTNGWVATGPLRSAAVTEGAATPGPNLTVTRTNSISGAVWADGDANGLRDPSELGIAAVKVFVDTNGNGVADVSEASALTNDRGIYRLAGLPAGAQTIRVVVPAGLGLSGPTAGKYTVTIASGGTSFKNDFALTSDRAPSDITLAPSTIAENAAVGTVVGTLKGVDPDIGDPLTYSLVDGEGGGDNASFTVAGGVLKSAASFDFEARSSLSIRARATDASGLFVEKVLGITVTNVNESPTAIMLSKSTVAENAGANATVGTLSTTDPDAGDAFTYKLVAGVGGDDNARFNLSGATLRATASFDYESRSTYTVLIRATDRGGKFLEVPFVITVTDVNDAPMITGITTPVTYEENGVLAAASSGVVTDVDSIDFDGGKLTVSVVANAQATDRMEIRSEGVGDGQVALSAGVVTYGGVAVGTATGGTSGTVPLVVIFNAQATAGVVQAVLRNFQYRSTSDNPSVLPRTLRYVLTDGDGGTSALVNQVVNIVAVDDAPVLAGITASVTYTENAVLLVSPSATVVDIDNANLSGGGLTVSIVANGEPNDRLAIRHQGMTAGLVGSSGGIVTYGGVAVGTVSGGTSGLDPLVVVFNTAATPAIAQAVLRNVTYGNVGDAPVAPLTRGLSYQLTDGSGGASAAVNQTIGIVPVNDAPVIGGIVTSGLLYSAAAGPTLLAEAATVNDVDSAALGGGILSVALTAGGLSTDRLTVVAQGTGPGQIGLSGSVVTFGGVAIGTSSGGLGTTALSIVLNAAATAEGVQALLRRIAFSSVATDPTGGGLAPTRTIRFTLSDAATSAGGKTTTVFQSIGVGA